MPALAAKILCVLATLCVCVARTNVCVFALVGIAVCCDLGRERCLYVCPPPSVVKGDNMNESYMNLYMSGKREEVERVFRKQCDMVRVGPCRHTHTPHAEHTHTHTRCCMLLLLLCVFAYLRSCAKLLVIACFSFCHDRYPRICCEATCCPSQPTRRRSWSCGRR